MKNDPVIEQFSRILQEKSRAGEGGKFLSYRFPLKVKNFDRLVISLLTTWEDVFYFHKPNENIRFIAIGKVFSIRSEGRTRFEELSAGIADFSPLFVRHFNGTSDIPMPLFVGSMSFFSGHHDPMWRDFRPSDWFVPELILAETQDGITASYQVDLNANAEKKRAVTRLEDFINSLQSGFQEPEDTPGNSLRSPDDAGKKEWMDKVSAVVDAIRRGAVNKVVLSRRLSIHGVDARGIVREITRAGKSFADSYIFLFKSGDSLFMGISPEKLASFSEGSVHCNAIAGSIARGANDEEDKKLGSELLNSPKNRDEHRIVVDHIKSVLNRHCSSVELDRFPQLKKLSYIQHLYTGAYGVLHPGVSMVRILEDLHPTPAVGGYPLVPALKMIEALEHYDRGLYTGFLGWFDAEGNGDFCVALRSALLVDDTLHAFAGGGIVVDSKPDEEYVETEIKLQAITSLIHP